MFRCTQGHLSSLGDKQVMVITKIRPVGYTEIATDRKRKQHPHQATGYEPVEERPYCVDHAFTAPQPVWVEPKHVYGNHVYCRWLADDD